ncbi:MAG: Bax inhibitor-1/YccA family protein [Spirochaetaceae bacterium]|jgi:FtsH-binding integral membrane protein|nr:Bax inhibitor-1/YccA family protein [Spirochaetaceae bacterium]
MSDNFTFAEQTALKERTILKNVYIWMSAGLFLTAVVAKLFVQTSLFIPLMSNQLLFFGIIIAEFALVIRLSRRIMNMSVTEAALSFAAYAILNGITLSTIFVVYSIGTIYTAFFVTAGTFGAMSLWALTTKRDLSGLGHFLMMGLIGLIIASVVNIFLRSSGLDFIISYAGVAIFTLLTAYDTQKIKTMSNQMSFNSDEATFTRLSIMGALKLYLDFINMFLFILRIFGRRS